MPLLNLPEKTKSLASQFKELHKDCKLEKQYYPGLWRRLIGKPIYQPGPYPEHFSYILSETPIGIGVDIKCNYCGEVIDITDYGSW